MKFPKHLIMCSFLPLLILQTCVKDSEENNDDSNDFTEIHYSKNETVTKAMAVEDWEMFLKQSQHAIDNAETNIGNLEIKIDEANDDQKQQWLEMSDSSNLMLIKLKAKRIKRNKEFESELKAYNPSIYERNEAFETQFSNEMSAINNKLTDLFEKMRSGYYK